MNIGLFYACKVALGTLIPTLVSYRVFVTPYREHKKEASLWSRIQLRIAGIATNSPRTPVFEVTLIKPGK